MNNLINQEPATVAPATMSRDLKISGILMCVGIIFLANPFAIVSYIFAQNLEISFGGLLWLGYDLWPALFASVLVYLAICRRLKAAGLLVSVSMLYSLITIIPLLFSLAEEINGLSSIFFWFYATNSLVWFIACVFLWKDYIQEYRKKSDPKTLGVAPNSVQNSYYTKGNVRSLALLMSILIFPACMAVLSSMFSSLSMPLGLEKLYYFLIVTGPVTLAVCALYLFSVASDPDSLSRSKRITAALLLPALQLFIVIALQAFS